MCVSVGNFNRKDCDQNVKHVGPLFRRRASPIKLTPEVIFKVFKPIEMGKHSKLVCVCFCVIWTWTERLCDWCFVAGIMCPVFTNIQWPNFRFYCCLDLRLTWLHILEIFQSMIDKVGQLGPILEWFEPRADSKSDRNWTKLILILKQMNYAQFKWLACMYGWVQRFRLEGLTTSCQLRQLYYFVITSLSSNALLTS